jgi:hypothetical protein
MLRRALVTLVYHAPCFGKVYEDVAQLPGLSYDFVVVGGETSLFNATLFDALKVEPLETLLQTA